MPFLIRSSRIATLLGALLVVAGVVTTGAVLTGCSGPQTTTTDDDTSTPAPRPTPVEPDPSPTGRALAQTETFDASQYPLRTPSSTPCPTA